MRGGEKAEQKFSSAFVADARGAVGELRTALDAVGIALPSLDVDPRTHYAAPVQLVELGRVRPDTARALARALRQAASVRTLDKRVTTSPDGEDRPTLQELVRRVEELGVRVRQHLARGDEGDQR